jgi:hypothetical protein
MGDWAHKSTCSLTPPIFIEKPVPSQESGLKQTICENIFKKNTEIIEPDLH